jgi:5-methyltetrahydropteroyltriglutamate--homocysteine methyltransferase
MALKYRADHVGSLLRPSELLDARKNPETTPEQLNALEDRYILSAMAHQKQAGLGIFTDGEFRRGGFMSDFYDSVEGLDQKADIARAWKGAPTAPKGIVGPGRIAGVVTEKIRQTKRLTNHEIDFLKRHSPGDIKMTLTTANQFPAIIYKKCMS